MTKYKRYQDYVINDGKLVGEFEAMYQDFEDPWDQSFREDAVLSKRLVEKILEIGDFEKPYEIGCGLGFFVEKMRIICGSGGVLIFRKLQLKKQNLSFQIVILTVAIFFKLKNFAFHT